MVNKNANKTRIGRSVRLGAILIGVFSLSLLLTWGFTRGDNRVIQTIAGTGVPGYNSDGGPATAAQVNSMQGLVTDSAGNLYIAETTNQVIRRVDASGVITTVAGLGPNQPGYNGDNIPAKQAKLTAPADVAVDGAGNLYIADKGNNRIRRIDTNGVITTVVGIGEPGFSGDGSPAAAARLNNPSAIVFDAVGNMYIADTSNNRIRRVDRLTGIITTIAGSGEYGFAGDGGPAIFAKFKGITDLAIGPSGDIFLTDSLNQRVRRISPDGIITTVAGNGTYNIFNPEDLKDGGPATEAVVRWPWGLTFDSAGGLYIAENASNRVRRVDANGTITTVAGSGDPRIGSFSGDNGPAAQAQLYGPSAVFVDGAGNIYISDSRNARVRKVSAQ